MRLQELTDGHLPAMRGGHETAQVLYKDLATVGQEVVVSQRMGRVREEPIEKAQDAAGLLERNIVLPSEGIKDVHFDQIHEREERYSFVGLDREDGIEAALAQRPGADRRLGHPQVVRDLGDPIGRNSSGVEGLEGGQPQGAHSPLLPRPSLASFVLGNRKGC
jgi:hypothetical protein